MFGYNSLLVIMLRRGNVSQLKRRNFSKVRDTESWQVFSTLGNFWQNLLYSK